MKPFIKNTFLLVMLLALSLCFACGNSSKKNKSTGDEAQTNIKYPLPKSPDSLLRILKNLPDDTNKVNVLNAVSFALYHLNPDSSIMFAQQSIAICKKLISQSSNREFFKAAKKKEAGAYNSLGIGFYSKGDNAKALENYFEALSIDDSLKNNSGLAMILGNIGSVYKVRADYSKALDCYFKSLKMDEILNNKKGIALTLGNIGIIYSGQADYPKALSYYFKALKQSEQINDKEGTARHLGNIGIVYKELNDYPNALDYNFKALKINEELGNKNGMAFQLCNIGIVYRLQADYSNALDYSFKALSIGEELGDKRRIATQFCNIGNVYENKKDYPKALDYYFKALKMNEELSNKNATAISLGNIGSLYLATGKFKEAEKYVNDALKISQDINALDLTRNQYQTLSELYDTTGRGKLAFEYYKKYIATKDSITNDANTKKQTQAALQYEFDKKTSADSIRNAEQNKQEVLKHNQEIQQQKIYTYGGAIGFTLMLVVAGVSFRAYRNKQKANEIISKQKLLVEEKQKEILDSIHYAKRIQQSLLPTEKFIAKNIERLKNKV